MKGKLIGYSTNDKKFTNRQNEEVNYTELWLTFAIPYAEGRGTGYYSKSIMTTKNQLNKIYDYDKLKLNKVYEVHYNDQKKLDFFEERKSDE